MGKVKGEEKFPNEVAVNRRRKKRRKELDLLRRNVLEAKRKLREKTAPPKTHTSTFNKILNSFADRRQANDNKTQGFDSKGRRAGIKKICNRLLPSRKPQVGIFANGAKGAEIKRGNLLPNELDKARFEGDLQKILSDGKQKSEESRSSAMNKILHGSLADTIEMETQKFIQMPAKKLEHGPVQNFVAERQSSKRKMTVAIESDGKTAKKPHSERIEGTDVVVQDSGVKSESKNPTDKKWKRSLFQDEMQDEFESISEPGIDQLRFSPTTDRAKVKVNPSEPKVFPEIAEEEPGTKRLNFNYDQLGKKAAAKYAELCTMVCAENFDTCLREIPHIDPLEKVKQSLINFYAETCKQKVLQSNANRGVLFAEESSNTSSHLIRSNIDGNKYFHEDGHIERSRPETVNVLPPRGICLANLRKFPHQETAEICSVQSKPLITKATELKNGKFIPCVTRGPPVSSETSIAGYNGSSLDVNYDSLRKSFRSDIIEFLKIDDRAGPSAVELDRAPSPRLSAIPSHRKKTVSRSMKEVRNPEPVKKHGPICPKELSAVSAENNDVQKCYLGDPMRRHEIRTKQGRNASERKLGEMYEPPLSEAGITENTRSPLDVNCNSVRTCSGLDLGEFSEIGGRARPTVVNLGSASRSTLASIPSDRGEFMLKFLQGVNNPETRKENRTTVRPEVFIVAPENNKLQKRYLGDPLRRHQIENVPVDRQSKGERHVPAILRKSQATKKNKKSNAAGTVLAKRVLEIGNLRWKTSNFNFQKISSTSKATPLDIPFGGQTLGKSPPIADRFPVDSDNYSNSKSSDLTKTISQTSQFRNRTEWPETPTVANAFCDSSEKSSKIERDFSDERFPYQAKAPIGQQKIGRSSGSVNYLEEFKLHSPATRCRKNSANGVALSNFHNVRQPQNVPIFLHQQRPDTKMHKVACDGKKISSLGGQDSQRFPMFLKRKTVPTSQNRVRHEGQHPGGLFPENGGPKVITIQNPNLREIGEEVRREISIPFIPERIVGQSLQPNGGGQPFAKYPGGIKLAMEPIQLQNGRQKIQQFTVPGNSSCHNVGQQVEPQPIPRCVCKTDLQNSQHMQLQSIIHQNGVRRVGNHVYTVQGLGNDPMNFFEPGNFDVPNSQRMFHHVPSANGRIPASCTSAYCGNTNFGTRQNCDSTEQEHMFDRRVGFVLPKNEQEPFCQNVMNLPIISDQISLGQNYSPVLSEDTNRDYKYIIDPRCPQAGYQWNQIDQSGAQIHQHIIQPAYNVTDAYRPQVPHSYFSTDS